MTRQSRRHHRLFLIQPAATFALPVMMPLSRTEKAVLAAFDDLVAAGAEQVRPGELAERLRETDQPIAAWEVRGVLASLAEHGEVALDSALAAWRRTPQAAAGRAC